MTDIVALVVVQTQQSAERIFWDAHCYYEERMHWKQVNLEARKWAERGITPQLVCDYCVEVLAHRIIYQ